MDTLPPIGQIGPNDHAGVVGYLTGLADEASRARQSWERLVDSNLQIYTYGADPAPDDDTLTANDIQNHILASTDIQTKEPPTATLEPVETGEPPICFWAGPQSIGIQLGLESFEVAAWLDEQGQLQPPLALAEEKADAVRQYVLDGMIKDTWLVELTDKLVADTYQTVFDLYWIRSGVDRWIRENLLSTNVQGWTIGLFEFDGDEQKVILRDISIRQAYLDPTQTDISQMAYAGFDLPFDAGEATKLYPRLGEPIALEARTGIPNRPEGLAASWGQNFEQDFRRPMIVLRVFWLRNQRVMLTPQEALSWGMVEQRAVPVVSLATGADGHVEDQPVDLGAQAAAGEDDEERPSEDAGVGAGESGLDAGADDGVVNGGGVAGVPSQSAAPSPTVVLRAAYFLAGTDQEVAPTRFDEESGLECYHPQWPCRLGIRQLTVIAGEVVDDHECLFWDIPLLHNVNVPIPGKPWGMGEPFRLKAIQRARNRVLGAMVEHAEYFRAPLTAIPQSVADALAEEYGDAHIRPDVVLKVPDEMYQALGGKIHSIIEPPQTPPALVALQGTLKSEMTEQSGHSEILQGRTQPQIKSGRAIELLQTASASVIGFKSQRTGDLVYRLSRLILDCAVWRLKLEDLLRIISRYPPHVLAAIQQRAKSIDWNVNVVISSGNGVIQQARKREALEQFQAGAIDLETLHEALGLDHRLIMQRMQAQAKAQAEAMAAAGVAPAGQGQRRPPNRGGK